MAIEIVVDLTERSITVGNYVSLQPHVATKQNWAQIAMDINLENPSMSSLELRDAEVFKAYRQAAFKLWIQPHRKEIMSGCLDSSGRVDQNKLNEFWSSGAPQLDSKSPAAVMRSSEPNKITFTAGQPALKAIKVEHGDMQHVLPILQFIQISEAKAARAIMGKSLWAAVNKNTIEKNQDLIGLVKTLDLRFDKGGIPQIKTLNDLPTTSFSAVCRDSVTECLAADTLTLKDIHFANVKFSDITPEKRGEESFAEVLRVMNDIAQMSQMVEGKIRRPSNFKPGEILATHQKYIEKTGHLKGYSKEEFGAQVRLEKSVRLPSGTAYLLDSAAKMIHEGNQMGHCIGGYSNRCRDGKYAAYHLIDNDKKHSSLGMIVRDYVPSSVEQHRGPANRQVSPISKQLCDELVNYLTEKYGANELNNAERRSDALNAMFDAETEGKPPIESRMAEVAERLGKAKSDGAMDMTAFLKTDEELDKTPSSVEKASQDATKGLAQYSNHMLSN